MKMWLIKFGIILKNVFFSLFCFEKIFPVEYFAFCFFIFYISRRYYIVKSFVKCTLSFKIFYLCFTLRWTR